MLAELLELPASESRAICAAFLDLPVAISMFDRDLTLVFANKSFASLYGVLRDYLVPGVSLHEMAQIPADSNVFRPKDPDRYLAECERWVEQQARTEVVHNLCDGRTIRVTSRFLPDGGWISTHAEITGQLRLGHEVSSGAKRYKRLLEALNIVPWEFDWSSQRFQYVGPQASQFGYPIEDWYGDGFWQSIIHPDDRDAAVASCKAATESGEDHASVYRIVKADGTIRWIRDIVSTMTDSGEAIVLRGIFVDITAQKQAEENLARQTAELKRSNQELQRFALVASHDLQEPLRKIEFCAQILKTDFADKIDGETREVFDIMQQGAERMRQLVSDILEYSQTVNSEKSADPIDLNDLVASILEDLDVPETDRKTEVVVDDLPSVRADRKHLKSIFQNLVTNAMKFNRSNSPRINIRGEFAGEFVRICVADNGIGIDHGYRERIFEMFQRLNTRSEYPGTGIGLSVVKRLVEQYGGRIWVDDSQLKDGETTAFSLLLPSAR